MNNFKQNILNKLATNEQLIIDTHTHVGLSLSQYVKGDAFYCQSIEELKLKMEVFGVDFSFVFPFPELNGNKVENVYYHAGNDFFRAEAYPYQLANENMFSEIIRKNYIMFIPFMIVQPNREIDQQIQCYEKYKDYTFGFKIHTTANRISPIDLPDALVEKCSKNNLPIIFHTRACQEQYNCWSVMKFASKHPDINVCIAHCAGFDCAFFQELPKYNNIYFDVSPLLSLCAWANMGNDKVISKNKLELDYSDVGDVFHKLFDLAPNRILWATDEPCGLDQPNKYYRQVALIKETDSSMRKQIHNNVCEFLTKTKP